MTGNLILVAALVILAVTAVILMVLLLKSSRENKVLMAKLKLMENHASISQIRPHFLYNCLNSIYYLCDEDPLIAKDAISNFSEYLRDDLEALSGETTVPFTKELEHIKRYIILEKLRFGDLLNIEYDVKACEFNLPVLSVQPLVENAIKHGIGKKKEGGTVKISTEKISDQIKITVEDDGVGFNVKNVDLNRTWVDENGKKHVGMSNVYARIETLAKGKVEVFSMPGRGTKVMLYIPAKLATRSI